jgi:predicted dehydrogenase
VQNHNGLPTIGIIGASGTAYKRTLPALKDSALCKVLAIQCRNLEQGNHIAKEFNIPEVYQSVDEMLRRSSFEIAYIATPPFRHLEDIRIATEFQRHIICEKPLARNLDEGLEIKKILNRSSSKFMLAHHLRHQPAIKIIHSLINDGKIGKVLNTWMQWAYQVNRQAKNAIWKLDKSLSGGGSLIDVGSHCIDLALELFVGVPNSVYSRFLNVCLSSVEDYAIVVLHYDSSVVIINTSFCMGRAGNCLLIQGTNGLIECQQFFGEKPVQKIDFFSKNEEVETFNLLEVNPYKEEVEDFVRSLATGTNARTSIEDSLNIMSIIEAAELSACKGQSIRVDVICDKA